MSQTKQLGLLVITLLVCLQIFSGCSFSQAKFGDWIVRLPEDNNYFYAVGGPSSERILSNDDARTEMAKFISVTVDSEVERITIEHDGTIETKVMDELRIKAKETLENVSIIEVRQKKEGYYSLARMPSRPVEDILESLRFKKVPPSTSEIVRSILLPGWGQYQKNQGQKGLAILSSQALIIGTTVLFHILKSSAEENMIYARTTGIRRAYQKDAQALRSLTFGSLITATAIYIYNLVDVSAVPKKVPLNPQ